jgi:hypothetical protein
MLSSLRTVAALLFVCIGASGCAVVSIAATGASLAVDAAVGTVKVVGGAASAVLPGKRD